MRSPQDILVNLRQGTVAPDMSHRVQDPKVDPGLHIEGPWIKTLKLQAAKANLFFKY